MFSSELLERLATQYPDRDISWLADEVKDAVSRGKVRNPEGALVIWTRNAERDGTHKKGARPVSPKREWGFYLEGNFTDRGDHHRGLTDFVRILVRMRRASDLSPAAIISQVPQDLLQAFPNREHWMKLVEEVDLPSRAKPGATTTVSGPMLWQLAPTSTAVESLVRYAGYSKPAICDHCDRYFQKGTRCACQDVFATELSP